MKLALFDTHRFERDVFLQKNKAFNHSLTFFDVRLTSDTALMAKGFDAVCAFANDKLDAACLAILKQVGIKLIALRSAGFNHVDLVAAEKAGLTVVRVPRYSPYSVAEHAVCLLLALNRKIHRAYARVREMNFSLDGLVGFDLHGKSAGVIGTGKIGAVFCRILLGFGCKVLANDLAPDAELAKQGVRYTDIKEVLRSSDFISLHVPLTPGTRHLINAEAFTLMKPGALLINTGRGALIDTPALIKNLKLGRLGGAGLDVYEEEEGVFFKDLSDQILQDDQLARLLTFPNVLITSHQGFLTKEALDEIARTTLQNAQDFEKGVALVNQVKSGPLKK